jgi:hAT family dimerisation domain.
MPTVAECRKEQVENEATRWLQQPNVPATTDILQWWADNEEEYPNLANMAAQFLSVPATSASAERLFSIAGLVFDDFRQHMKDGTLEDMLWAHINKFKRARMGHKLT